MTIKDWENRYDHAHEAWLRDPTVKNTEALDRVRRSLWRARNPVGQTEMDASSSDKEAGCAR